MVIYRVAPMFTTASRLADRGRGALPRSDRAVDEGRPDRRGLGAGEVQRADRVAHRRAEQHGRPRREKSGEAAAGPLLLRPVRLVVADRLERRAAEALATSASSSLRSSAASGASLRAWAE